MFKGISSACLFAIFLLSPAVYAACSPGTYPNGNSCQSCQQGWYCPDGKNMLMCGFGKYSAGGASQCTTCPAGSECNTLTTFQPQLCSTGTYSSAGASSCTNCGPGKFSSVQGATTCCECCANSYNDQRSATGCQACPNQNPYSNPGATSTGDCHNAIYFFGNVPLAPLTCTQQNTNQCPATTGTTSSHKRKRSEHVLCPKFGQQLCPVLSGRANQKECVDVQRDLESCGGCMDKPVSQGGGVDCTTIPGVSSVGCERGQCIVSKCIAGFTISNDRNSCVPLMASPVLLQGTSLFAD